MDNQAAIADVERVEDTAAAETQKAAEITAEAAKTGATDAKAVETTKDDGKTAEATSEAAKAEEDGKKPAWADDWREQVSGGDEDRLKLAKRYGSPAGILKALQETQAKLRAGTAKPQKPDPSDKEAMAEWRKAEGIPETGEGYVLPETVKTKILDEDKPILAKLTDYAAKRGETPASVNFATEFYYDTMEAIAADRKAKDAKDAESLETTLREDWGREYKANYELGRRFLSSVPGVGQEWANAVLPDGRLLGNVPEFVQWASDQGRSEFGDATFASSDSEARHTSRKAEIDKIRTTDFDRYEREGLDKEYRAIIEKDLARAKR